MICGVRLEDVFEQLAGGGLAAFCHPVVGEQDVTVRPPDAVDEDGGF